MMDLPNSLTINGVEYLKADAVEKLLAHVIEDKVELQDKLHCLLKK